MTASKSHCIKIRRAVIMIMQSATPSGIFRQKLLTSQLPKEQLQLQLQQYLFLLEFSDFLGSECKTIDLVNNILKTSQIAACFAQKNEFCFEF